MIPTRRSRARSNSSLTRRRRRKASIDSALSPRTPPSATTTIARPPVGETRIKAGTKIDNLVHVAHGVSIGRRVLLTAQSGIAGSTVIEDDVMMAGQSGVTDHVHIGAGARVGAKSAVLGSVAAGEFVTGPPAIDHREWRKASVVFRRLPSLKKRVDEHEQRIAELEDKLAEPRSPDR